MTAESGPPRPDPGVVLMRLLRLGFAAGGTMSIGLGGWMLFNPRHWFVIFPGAIEDFSPFSPHFIRDLGGWFIAGGVLLLFALSNPIRFGGAALVVSIVSYGSHAGIHTAEIVGGSVPANHWLIDAPTIFVPFLIFLLLTWIWWTVQSDRAGRKPEAQQIEADDVWDPDAIPR